MNVDSEYRGLLPLPTEDNGFAKVDQGRVTFLLGTDEHIGSEDTSEKRVAITPDQCALLHQWLAQLGISLQMMVVAGAGAGARFSDEAYAAAGAEIIPEADLPGLEQGPNLVHALKESTAYEATIPGPFLRIGALHSGDFKPGSGLAEVLCKQCCHGIFDGSVVGGFAYHGDFDVKPKFLIPLRSSMSVYAGKLAGEDVGERLTAPSRVVVSGGGVVGTSAVGVLLDRYRHFVEEILIVEKFEERCQQLREMYAEEVAQGMVKVRSGTIITDEDLRGTMGLILTIFIQGSGATPRVVDVEQLAQMGQGGTIVDVAIDEGGGIRTDLHQQVDMVTAEMVRGEIDKLGRSLVYEADNHMPRRRPNKASVEHGDAALMYLGTLLYLIARQGGTGEALKHIMDTGYIIQPKTICTALIMDLKHGLAFSNLDGVTVLYRHALKKSDDISAYLSESGVRNVFA